MSKTLKLECLSETSIMQGFDQYLSNCNKVSEYRSKMYVNLVRKFHDYVGKSYADIEKVDIQGYLSFLKKSQHLKDSLVYVHFVAIKKFYKYLQKRGEISDIPIEGLRRGRNSMTNLSDVSNEKGGNGESQDHLLYVKEGVIAKLTLNRPKSLNAFSLPMIKGWAEALQDAQNDPNIRVVVLNAAGKAFCAGGDVKSMLAGKGFIADDEKGECWGDKAINRKGALMNYIHKVALTMEGMDKPVICAINGAAVGAGLDMALMCDIRIAADTAQLSGGYVKAGLVPGDGGCYFMPRLVGVAKALELLWTADFITAEEGLHIGMVNKVVPADKLEEATMEMARKIANQPPVHIQMIKRAVYSSQRTHDLRTALDMISSHMAIVTEMDDYKEGVAAIKEKRKPEFKGK